jgi:hypothetical protein
MRHVAADFADERGEDEVAAEPRDGGVGGWIGGADNVRGHFRGGTVARPAREGERGGEGERAHARR